MQESWFIIILGFGLLVFAFANAIKRSRKFREFIDGMLLRAPVFGPILHKSALARFCRTTSTMFSAGVPLVEAMQSVAGATGSFTYGNAVLDMRYDIASGQSMQISRVLTVIFPLMVLQMVAIGEESGALYDMLGKVADFYEEEVDNAVDALSSLMEPMIMVVLGTVVGGLVVAMYLPIFKMGAAI